MSNLNGNSDCSCGPENEEEMTSTSEENVDKVEVTGVDVTLLTLNHDQPQSPDLCQSNHSTGESKDVVEISESESSASTSTELQSSSKGETPRSQVQKLAEALREWGPLSALLHQIPLKAQKGFTTMDLKLTCVAAAAEYLALGTNVGLVYWYNRKSDCLVRLKTENTSSPIIILSLVSTVDYMLAAGNGDGLITIFQIPKSHDNVKFRHVDSDNSSSQRPAIQKFEVSGLHVCKITALEWTNNGMKLFSGDTAGGVVLTDLDYELGRIKSSNLLDEKHEIVQLSYARKYLLVCSTLQSVVYSLETSSSSKVGTQDRKTQGKFGGIFQKCLFNDNLKLFSVRPGGRLWISNCSGTVEHTIKFKDLLLESHFPNIPVISPTLMKYKTQDFQIGSLYRFMGTNLATQHKDILYILDPVNTRIAGVCKELKAIQDIAVNEYNDINEIFVLESDRIVTRISNKPDEFSSFDYPNSQSAEFLKSLSAIPNIMRTNNFHVEQPINFLTSKFKETSRALPKINSTFLQTLKQVIEVDIKIQVGQFTTSSTAIPLRAPDIPDIACESDVPSGDNIHNYNQPSFSVDKFEHISQLPFDDVLLVPPRVKKKHKKRPKTSITSMPDSVFQSSGDTVSLSSSTYSTNSEEDPSALQRLSTQSESDINNLTLRTVLKSNKKPDFALNFPTAMSQSLNLDQVQSQNTSLPDLETKEEILAMKLNWPELIPESRRHNRNLDICDSNSTAHLDPNINGNCGNFSEGDLTTEPLDDDYLDGDGSSSMLTLREAQSNKSLSSNLQAIESLHSLESDDNSSISNVFDQSLDIYTKYAPKDESSISSALSFGPPSTNSNSSLAPGKISDQLEPRIVELDETCVPDLNLYSDRELEFDASNQTNMEKKGVSLENLVPVRDMVVNPIPVPNDVWVSFKLPASVQHITACEQYVICTDKKTHVYVSQLENSCLRWIQTQYQASLISISPCASVLWRLHKGTLYSLVKSDGTLDAIVGVGNWAKLLTNVVSISVQKHVGWVVKQDGSVFICSGLLWSSVIPDFEKVNSPYSIYQIATAGESKVWAVTQDGRLLYRVGVTEDSVSGTHWVEKSFPNSPLPSSQVSTVAVGPSNSVWFGDMQNSLYFVDGISDHCPGGNENQWKIGLGDYVSVNGSSAGTNNEGRSGGPLFFTSLKNRLSDSLRPDRITSFLSAKTAPIVCGTKSSVWYSVTGSTKLYVNKAVVEGHRWTLQKVNRPLRPSNWTNVYAGSIYVDHGYLWLLDPKGKLLYWKPTEGGDAKAIDLPCSTGLACITPAPDALWILSKDGKIFARRDISPTNAVGFGWIPIELSPQDGVHLVHISCGSDVAWACDIKGNIFMRVGSLRPPSPNDISPAWVPVPVDGTPILSKNCIFSKVYVGTSGSMVWALDNMNNVYVREATYPDFPIGTQWLRVSGIEATSLALSDNTVWALSPKGEILRRHGITATNFVGDYWKKVPGPNLAVLTVSLCDEVWALDSLGQLLKHFHQTLNFKEVKKERKPKVVLDPEDRDWELVESL